MSFCSLKNGITSKIRMLCFVILINGLFNLLCVWFFFFSVLFFCSFFFRTPEVIIYFTHARTHAHRQTDRKIKREAGREGRYMQWRQKDVYNRQADRQHNFRLRHPLPYRSHEVVGGIWRRSDLDHVTQNHRCTRSYVTGRWRLPDVATPSTGLRRPSFNHCRI